LRFDLPLDLLGTPFQRKVWQALLGIACGATLRYGDIAVRVGVPSAARAVGAAVGRNPLSIVVPCHRVLGSGGALTGYAGGLERKVALLELERGQHVPPTGPRRSVAAGALRRGPRASATASPRPPVAT
jgi:methylated-DNA-[protein]-cysteine S-methyltransferase